MRHVLAELPMVLLVSAGLLTTAEARTNLNGTYAFVGPRTCTLSSTPFQNDASGAPTVIAGPVFRQSAVDTGTFKFKPDGTGIQTGRSSTIDLTDTNIGDSIQSISEFSVPFTYIVNCMHRCRIPDRNRLYLHAFPLIGPIASLYFQEALQ